MGLRSVPISGSSERNSYKCHNEMFCFVRCWADIGGSAVSRWYSPVLTWPESSNDQEKAARGGDFGSSLLRAVVVCCAE